MSEWKHKDEWTRRGKHFLVKVSRHGVPTFADVDGEYKRTDEIEHRWCIYAYFFPKHPYFGKFEGDDMWQAATGFFDWHGGCTYLEYHRDKDGDPFSIQVGADYNHAWDERFSMMATKDDAFEVFQDADDLFDTVAEIGKA